MISRIENYIFELVISDLLKMDGKVNFEWRKRVGPVLTLNVFNRNISLCFCHRKEERCFKIRGRAFPICSRCCGILFGIPLALLLLTIIAKLPIAIGFVLIIPLMIDGLTQSFSQRNSYNYLRFVTGSMFSLGFLLIIKGGV